MDYERYAGSRGQEILVSETDIMVIKDGQWVKTYYFDSQAIRVEVTGHSSMGAAIGGLLGAAVVSAVTANYQLHIINSDGKTEKVPLHVSGKEADRLEQHIKEINLRKAGAAEQVIYSCKHTFAGYPILSYVGNLVIIWLLFGGSTVWWIKMFFEDMLEWSSIDAVMWIMPVFFLLSAACCTLLIHISKKNILISIEVSPEMLIIDQKQFSI